MGDVTQLMKQIEAGNQQASAQLLPVVYQELRRLAQHRLGAMNPNQTLQATALVHEAYVRLVDSQTPQSWDSKAHFFSAAAEAMRRILVEQARRKDRQKHGGDWQRVSLSDSQIVDDVRGGQLESLDAALTKLQQAYPEKAELIMLRFFAGLTEEQAALAMGISRATASRYWTFGRAWLFKEMKSEP